MASFKYFLSYSSGARTYFVMNRELLLTATTHDNSGRPYKACAAYSALVLLLKMDDDALRASHYARRAEEIAAIQLLDALTNSFAQICLVGESEDVLARAPLRIFKQLGANKLVAVGDVMFEVATGKTGQFDYAGEGRIIFPTAGFVVRLGDERELEAVLDRLGPGTGARMMTEASRVVREMSRDFSGAIETGGKLVD